ncbi:hypothetical protein [Dinghuibacter silviterrae]|uniref:Uncharacterized protein n=1 Tax=Dinghuibacter silviterrae TaxID=1539049 RepID=A0A4R8DIG9_9BACT|nr:hypothetical protein [Dinghuibacter silviterrae]TDW97094.1 hypothetical protein EDB95_4934 [Dinghuibacter silviterrae]
MKFSEKTITRIKRHPLDAYWSAFRTSLENGSFRTMKQLGTIIPITQLTIIMRLNYNTLAKRLLDPSRFTVSDLKRLAHASKVKPEELLKFILKETSQKP